VYRDDLYCSVRTTDRDANAGELLQKVLGARSAGGHDMIAGGRVPLPDDPPGRERMALAVRDRVLRTLGGARAKAQPLVNGGRIS